MQSIGSQAGFCTIHQIDKMFVGLEDATEPTCVRCVAAATPKLGKTQTVQDPGEGFFSKDSTPKITPVGVIVSHPMFPTDPVRLEDVVGTAIAQLKRLPMPEDIKQFKAVQKVIKTLESLLEK